MFGPQEHSASYMSFSFQYHNEQNDFFSFPTEVSSSFSPRSRQKSNSPNFLDAGQIGHKL
jgi:hypothetical protein